MTETLVGRYRVLRELGHGGMGTVLLAVDGLLGREVAIKRIRDEVSIGADVLWRFVEEAQVAGQLEHPGIVPVHEIGLDAERRPYLVMQLVQGRTLAERLEEGLPRAEALALFERLARVVAYAHARGVVHRDLKPANVMLGATGEVRVLDWGLAKVVAGQDGPPPGEAEAGEPPEKRDGSDSSARVRTLRSSSGSSSHSIAGSVFGTPAYMAPEQARGEWERVDARADVFALGSILCELLSGRPAFVGTLEETLAAARAGDVSSALERVQASGPDPDPDPEWVALARTALAPDPAARFPDAGALVERLEADAERALARAREAEIESARARIEAQRERRAWRLTLVLVVVALFGAAVSAAAWARTRSARRHDQVAAEQDLRAALDEVRLLQGRARAGGTELSAWTSLEGALERAGRQAGADVPASLRDDLARLEEEIEAESAAAARRRTEEERERATVAALEACLVEWSESFDNESPDPPPPARFGEVFASFGLDVQALPDEELAARVRASPIEDALVAGLQDWAYTLFVDDRFQQEELWPRLLAIAQLAAPAPWRERLIAGLLAGTLDFEEVVGTDDLDLGAQGWRIVCFLASPRRDRDTTSLFRRALRAYPTDFWLNLLTAEHLIRRRAPVWGIYHCEAAVALEPDSTIGWRTLCSAASIGSEPETSLALAQRLLRVWPGEYVATRLLLLALKSVRRNAEAKELALALLEQHSGDPILHDLLADILLYAENDPESALPHLEEAVRLDPDQPFVLHNLGYCLLALGEPARAIEPLERSRELNPGRMTAQAGNLIATAYEALGDTVAAAAEYAHVIAWLPEGLNEQKDYAPEHLHALLERLAEEDEPTDLGDCLAYLADAADSRRPQHPLIPRLFVEAWLVDPRPEGEERAVRIAQALVQSARVPATLELLARVRERQGEPLAALELYEEALDLGGPGREPTGELAQRLARVRTELLPDLPTYGTIDAHLAALAQPAAADLQAFFGAARGDDALARVIYAEARLLQRQGDLAEAEEAFRGVSSEDPAAVAPYLALLEVLAAARGHEAAVEELHALLADGPAPERLLPLAPEPMVVEPMDEAGVAEPGADGRAGPGCVLHASPFRHADPRVTLRSVLWELRREDGDYRRSPAMVLEDRRPHADGPEWALPVERLEEGRRYLVRVTATASNGLSAGPSPEVAFLATGLGQEHVPVDLGPHFTADVVRNAGDPTDESMDEYHESRLLVQGEEIGGVPDVDGLPPDGRVGSHRLGGYDGKNAVVLSVGAAATRPIAVPPGRYRALLLLATCTNGDADLEAELHFADGTSAKRSTHVPDWFADAGDPRGPRDGCVPVIDGMDRWFGDTVEDANDPALFEVALDVPTEKELVGVTLRVEPSGEIRRQLFLFALTGVRLTGRR